MRVVLQRVSEAAVEVEGSEVARIAHGWLALLGVERDDTEADAEAAARRTVELRAFPDAAGRMNLALEAVGGAVLAVSQFTLAGSLARGRRPSFERAMAPERARELFERFVAAVAATGRPVATGVFAAHMRVRLVNDGPVTFVLDTRDRP